jgi:hypothetical protein
MEKNIAMVHKKKISNLTCTRRHSSTTKGADLFYFVGSFDGKANIKMSPGI